MKRVLIKCGWLVTLDPGDRRYQGRRTAVRGNTHRGRRPQPRRHRRRDDRRLRQDRDAGPGQRPHAHLGDGAARHRRGMDVGRLFQARASQPGDALQARGQLRRQPDGRAGPDRRRRHHAGRLVPQHHHARARRARGRRPGRQRHPRGVRARHRQADRAGRPARRSPTCRIRASASRRCARAGSPATTAASRSPWRSSGPTGAPGRWSSTTSAWRASSASCRRRTRAGARTAWCPDGYARMAEGGPARARPQPGARHQLRRPPTCGSSSTAARR